MQRHHSRWVVSVAALMVLGSGACSAQAPAPGPSSTQPSPTSTLDPSTSAAGQGSAGHSTASTTASSPATSTGPVFDSSHQLTDAEAMTLYRQSLVQFAKDLTLTTVPKVAFVRFIGPDEFSAIRVACLNDLGLPAKAKPGGHGYSIPSDVPDSQKDFINETQYKCEAMYPIHPQFELPPSTATQGRIYDWLVTKQMPCYRAQGFPVPDPPSKAVWVAAFNAGPTWGPDASIPQDVARNSTAMAELNRKCPSPYPADVNEYVPVIKK